MKQIVIMSVEFYTECKNKISEELLNFNGTKISILEASHRSKTYEKVHNDANKNLTKLLNIPDDFTIMWFQGERELQYGAICMNIIEANKKPGYIITGDMSRKAYEEGKALANGSIAFDLQSIKHYDNLPNNLQSNLQYDKDCAFLFYIDEEDSNGFACPTLKGMLSSFSTTSL